MSEHSERLRPAFLDISFIRLSSLLLPSEFVADRKNEVFSQVEIHRSRLLLANGFTLLLVLRYRFFVRKSQYL